MPFRSLVILVLAGLAALPANAAALLDVPQLAALMKATPAHNLIDARGEEQRKRRPIPFSITYQPGLALKPGVAVVVAEDDTRALEAARRLEARKGVSAFAARGGYDAWREASDSKPVHESIMPQSFTIPHNTCEQGRSLQEYK